MSARLVTFSCAVPGNPGAAKVNTRTTPIVVGGRSRMISSSNYRAWKRRAALVAQGAAKGQGFGPLARVLVHIDAYWPRQHRRGAATGLALGDVDAVGKAVLDAMQAAGVLDDDAQVIDLRLRKYVDATKPRIEIRAWTEEA